MANQDDVRSRVAALSPEQRALLKQQLLSRAASKKPGSHPALEAIPLQPRQGQPFPLSFAQQRMWFLEQLKPGTSHYNTPFGVRIRGPLAVEHLAESLSEVVQRHEALRTYFVSVHGDPVQIIESRENVELRLVDIRDLPVSTREDDARRMAQEESRRPFDLSAGPPFRASLFRLSDQDHVLVLVLHHIITDAWSLEILFREMSAGYEARVRGKQSSLPPLPVQYADFAVWQRTLLEGPQMEAEFAFWRAQLAGAPATLELPTDFSRPLMQTVGGETEYDFLPPALSEGVEELARRERGTPFMVMMAAFQIMMSRYSAQEDIVVGTPIAGRTRSEIEPLIGCFINTLAIRSDLSGDPNVRQLIEKVRHTSLEAFAHQELPFEKLVEKLNPQRQTSHAPLFQTMFMLQTASTTDREMYGLEVTPLDLTSGSAKFDLTLAIVRRAQGMRMGMTYNVDLFEPATARRMLGHFRTLLEGMVANPDARISSLPLLSMRERDQILVDWNRTAANYPREKCIYQLFEDQVEHTPEKTAVIFEGKPLTYGELNRRANLLAGHLRDLGVGPDVLVGLCAERSLEMLVGEYAILKAGGAYVPLDPSYPSERIAFMIEDSGIRVLLTQQRLLKQLPAIDGTTFCLDSDWSTIAAGSTQNLDLPLASRHLAYMIYTSGSTGKPKGVQIEHGSVVNFLNSMSREPGLTAGDTLLAVTTLSFDIAGLEIHLTLSRGGTLYLASQEVAAEGTRLRDALTSSGATVMQATPATWRMLIEAGWQGTPGLKILCGGEALPRDLAQQLLERGSEVWNLYGPTETTIWSAAFRVSEGKILLGRPIDNTLFYVLDRNQQPVPAGIPGELFIGGDGLARCYYKRPELTAERFLADPFRGTAGARMYRTGDLVRYLKDGNLEYLGRMDHQVKLRGFRIELGEIEAALRKHPSVQQCVVVAREDAPGNKRLVAYLVATAEAPRREDLRTHLKASLPDYMVPSQFVTLDKLPLTPNEKIDRKALPAPEKEISDTGVTRAPQTPTEEMIVGIWQDVLGVERIGAEDSFFDLGGHSLLATRLVARVRQALGVELPLRSMFESPTPAGMASAIDALRRSGRGLDIPPIASVARDRDLPLSFAQQRLWFLNQMEPDNPFYSLPWAMRMQGRLDKNALERSLQDIVARHEVLRTRFVASESGVTQVVDTAAQIPLKQFDLSGVAAASREDRLQEQIKREIQQPFDLARGPLMRAALWQLSDDEYVLLLNIHHIATDRWSMSIMAQELSAAYAANTKGTSASLPALNIQYADYSVWQREWLQGDTLRSQLNFWREHLAGAPPVLELPTDRPRPAVQTFDGASCSLEFSKDLSVALRQLSRRENATLFMTMLAAYNVLLARHSGQEGIVVGTPIANRRWAETDGLIGFFANTLALRTSLSGDPSFRELLTRVKETALGAYAHQDLPFEKLVEELQPDRSLSHNPVFQTVFALQESLLQPPDLPELALSRMPIHADRALFDMSLFVAEGPNGLLARLEYNRDLFDKVTAERMLEHFRVLLEGIAAKPEALVFELPLITEAERHQLLVEWNSTRRPYPQKTVAQLFEEQVELTPNALALVFEDEKLTYRELNRRANRVASQLRERGVRKNDLVGISMERCLEMVVGLLAILKAGAAYVPVDPNHPAARLEFMLGDAGVRVVLTRGPWDASLPESVEAVHVDGAPGDAAWDANVISDGGLDDLAYVMYTSGSTGTPKGVEVPHRAIVRLLFEGGFAQLDRDQVLLQLAPLAFDASTLEIWGALLHGGRCVLFPERVPSAEALGAALRKHEVTTLWLTSSLFNSIIDEAPETLTSVKHVLTGGEALSVPHIRRAVAALPNTLITNGYGPTESTTFTTTHPIPRELPANAASIPIGRPIGNTQVYVLDRKMQPAPLGVTGELYIGGDGLAKGYLNRPELTRERFVVDPFTTGARLYRTGDLVRYLPDGTLDFQGRVDHQVKIRGFRIELGEIEACLRSHAGVQDAVVVMDESAAGQKRLIAYAASQKPPSEVTAQLRKLLGEKLPEYMLPSAFVVMAKLPMTASGKINRRELPPPDITTDTTGYTAPRYPAEELIAGIWTEVLKRPSVGIHDDFFQAGGHSLLAAQVISRIRKIFGVELPLRSIFESPTVAALAGRVDAIRNSNEALQTPPLVPMSRNRHLPLSFAQQRVWFFTQLEPESSFYNMPRALRLRGKLDVDALCESLNTIVARHEVLRTSFTTIKDQPVQVITSHVDIEVPVIDLRHLDEQAREAEAQRLLQDEGQRPFDLAQAPLLRCAIYRMGEEDHIFMVVFHHIASDGWSFSIFFQELELAYTPRLEKRLPSLPDLPIQYADYAVWQREWQQGQVLEGQLRYWRQLLRGVPPLLALPWDRPRPAVANFRGNAERVSVDGRLTESLKGLSRREGATLFITLLAAFQLWMGRLSGQDDVVVGTDWANRGRVETEKLIGFFINLVPLRANLSGNPSFRDLLARVRETALGAFSHQDVPFDKLVEELRLERSAAYNPLVQVLFVMQNTPRQILTLPGLEALPVSMTVERSKFDMAVFVSEKPDGLAMNWVYSTDLFDEASIQKMAAGYCTLLESIVAQPEMRILALESQNEEDKQQKAAEQQVRKQMKLNKFKSAAPKAVNLISQDAADGDGERGV
jgi:amino acid adenylation domain-containing protein